MLESLVEISQIFLAAIIAVGGILVIWTVLRSRLRLKRGEKGKVLSSKIPRQRQRVEELYSQFTKRHSFQVGQLVRWKPGLRNRVRPLYDQPGIVIEILDEPVRDLEKTGSSYYREPLDIVVGIIDEDGDFVFYHFDSGRFEPLPDAR